MGRKGGNAVVRVSAYGQGSYLVMAGNDVVRTHGGAPFILKVGE